MKRYILFIIRVRLSSSQTVSALQTFFLAMVLYPAAQAQAQAQLDSVIGTNRLPEFDDTSSLPYIEAILMETLRWHPVLPLGMCPWQILPNQTFVLK